MTNGVKKTDKTKGEIRTIYADIRDFRWSHGLMVSMVQKVSGNAIMRISVRTQKGPPMGDLYGRFLCIL